MLAAPLFGDTTKTFIYNGTPSSTGVNESVEADFIVSGGNLLVTLYNTTSNLTFDKQILTGVLFSYAGAGSATGTVSNPTVQGYTINDSNGHLTASGSPAGANWHTEIDLTGYVTLTNLNNGNGGGSKGIIATTTNPAGTNNLSNHDPYLEGPVQFTISGLGLTSSSQITGAQFNFGTAIGTYSGLATSPVSTPEPATLSIAAGALLGLLALSRRRQTS